MRQLHVIITLIDGRCTNYHAKLAVLLHTNLQLRARNLSVTCSLQNTKNKISMQEMMFMLI